MPEEAADAAEMPEEKAAEDAFGADEAAEDAVEEKPASRPKPKKPSEEAAEEAPAEPSDPAVLAVMESHPSTPAELLRAIEILIDLDEAALAKGFVDELGQVKLDQTGKAALAAQFNSATLLKLAHNSQLQAVLAPFIDDLLHAADAYRRDPQRLVEWARQLGDRNESVRAHASLALLRSREAAVAPLVAILADPKRAGESASAKRILVHLGDLAVEPLLGVLEGPDAALKTQVVEILGTIRSSQAVAPLEAAWLAPQNPPQLRSAAAKALERTIGRLPTAPEAIQQLQQSARRTLDQSRHADEESQSALEVWHWNSRRRESMPIEYTATGAALARAVRLTRALYTLDTSNSDYRRLYLISLLEASKFRLGLDKPLPTGNGTAYAIVAHQGVAVVNDLLASALADGYTPAATAAAQILGDIGNSGLLSQSGAAPCPLVVAAEHPDRRLRFAAVEAILKFKPREPFPGSSKVVDALGFFASSFGAGRVLVAHPRSDQGRALAGLAAGLGFEGEVATNGRRAFELAIASPDVEFVLIHSAIDRPKADQLLAQLRRDRRTALLPIGFMAPEDDLDRVERFARKLSRAEASLQPQNEGEMKLFTERVLAHGARAPLTADERLAQAGQAIDWLASLARQRSKALNVGSQEAALVQALAVPQLAARAVAALASFGSARAQHSLLEVANMNTQPIATRQAAVAALVSSLDQYGLRLTREEILRQYDLYNTNAGRDPATHEVSGAILDAIEGRANNS
jgi:hypothetical protein